MVRHIVLTVAALLLSACVTGERITELQPGMSRAQVVSILGAPTGVQRRGNSEALHYANRLMSGWSWDRTDYYVILQDGAVTEYGHGEVRVHQPNNTLILIPIQ